MKTAQFIHPGYALLAGLLPAPTASTGPGSR